MVTGLLTGTTPIAIVGLPNFISHIRSGAVKALARDGKSLLSIGVVEVTGDFERGAVVGVLDDGGREVARGLINYSSEEARRIMRRPSSEIESVLGYSPNDLIGKPFVDTLAPAITRLEGKEDARALVALRASIGVAYLQLRDFEAGIAAIDRARREGGADPGLDALRIQARLEANRVEEALGIAVEARREDPLSQRLLGLEADARLRHGERDKAFALYQQSIDADGSDVDTHIAFAGLLLEAKEFTRAERVLTSARPRFPDDTSIPFQLGAVFEEQARYEDAERAFRDALLIDPKHAPSLNYLGYMLAERGAKLDEAVKLLHEAVDLDPYNGSYLDSLGWAYFKRGAYDQARTYLMRAGDQLPRNSVVQDHVGDMLFATPVLIGGLEMGKHLMPGTDLAGERSAEEIRKIAAGLS